jgi:hypothetical protein
MAQDMGCGSRFAGRSNLLAPSASLEAQVGCHLRLDIISLSCKSNALSQTPNALAFFQGVVEMDTTLGWIHVGQGLLLNSVCDAATVLKEKGEK